MRQTEHTTCIYMGAMHYNCAAIHIYIAHMLSDLIGGDSGHEFDEVRSEERANHFLHIGIFWSRLLTTNCEGKREKEDFQDCSTRASPRLTFDPRQSCSADDAEAGQVVGHLLLVGVITALHSTLIQSVVVAEDKLEDVPEQAGMEQLGLQPRLLRECRARLHRHAVQLGQVLEGGGGGGGEEYIHTHVAHFSLEK